MGSQILLFSQNEEDRNFASQLAAVLTTSLIVVRDWSELASLLLSGAENHFFIDVSNEQSFETYVQHAVGKIGHTPGSISPAQIHLIVDSELSSIPASLQSDHYRYFLVRKYGNFEEAAKIYGRLMMSAAPCTSSDAQELAIEDLLKLPSELNQVTLTHSDHKAQALDKVRQYLTDQAATSDRIIEIILNGLDEVLMNAIYDAPVDENGNQRLTKIPRNTPIALDEKSQVELYTAYDGECFVFKVVDRFGSVDQLKLLRHIFLGSQDHFFQVNDSIANAGVGIASTFRMGASLMFISKKSVRTEVVVCLKFFSSFREFKNQFRFLTIHGS